VWCKQQQQCKTKIKSQVLLSQKCKSGHCRKFVALHNIIDQSSDIQGRWPWGLGCLDPLKICRRGQSMFWPLKCQLIHSKLLFDYCASFTSSRSSKMEGKTNSSRRLQAVRNWDCWVKSTIVTVVTTASMRAWLWCYMRRFSVFSVSRPKCCRSVCLCVCWGNINEVAAAHGRCLGAGPATHRRGWVACRPSSKHAARRPPRMLPSHILSGISPPVAHPSGAAPLALPRAGRRVPLVDGGGQWQWATDQQCRVCNICLPPPPSPRDTPARRGTDRGEGTSAVMVAAACTAGR